MVNKHKTERKGKEKCVLLAQNNAVEWIWYVYVFLRDLNILQEEHIRYIEF